ncbi:MAG TPA: hypothetical protein VJ954_09220 [Ignavibacteriaceae bacterium]|nr:hypothetical protein [Ignavibacteriaceae bacterium]
MKKLFTNYNFEFDKNEKKLLTTFCRQTLKQIEGDNRYYAEERTFNSLISKLTSDDDTIKLTKDERIKLKHQLEENVKFLKEKSDKSWFIKKWMYKSMLNQYSGILNNHFRN